MSKHSKRYVLKMPNLAFQAHCCKAEELQNRASESSGFGQVTCIYCLPASSDGEEHTSKGFLAACSLQGSIKSFP